MAQIASAGQCSAAHLDIVSGVGERLSNKIMGSYLRDHGIGATDLAADGLIMTTGEHGAALPLLPQTTERVHPIITSILSRGEVPCLTGFIGTAPDGSITTLGRGGSDLTAAVLANVLDAEEVILSKVEYREKQNGWMDMWLPGWIGFVHQVSC